jgi:Protein of unknown function (DUF1186)/SEC-C motif
MDAAELIARLAFQDKLPIDTIRAASAEREAAAPIFVNAIEQFVRPGGDRSAKDSLFFIFHLLGDWREKSAYRPLARLLRCPCDDVDEILGGAITETTHRVMAAVFDGDPGPLYEIILDPQADEYIRSRMLEAMAMATLRGEMPRAEAARFLRACYSQIEPQDECWVWHGWQSAIAFLGLAELKPLVEEALARGFICDGWLELKDFEEDLQLAVDDPDAIPQVLDEEYSLFGDTIEELSTWYCFRPKETRREFRPMEIKREERETIRPSNVLWEAGTAVNRYRNVGRNDPCPCGSGRKFKKCCLTADIGLTALQAM